MNEIDGFSIQQPKKVKTGGFATSSW